MSNNRTKQLLIHQYRDEFGERDLDMHEVAEWAIKKGYLKLPTPVPALDVLARELSRAAREETKVDKKTLRPYRVNHARLDVRAGKQVTLWCDIDEAPREAMEKCFVQRRQQMVGDAVQLSDDVDHWNGVNPSEQSIAIEFDFGPDIEWRKNAPNDEREAG